MYRNAITSELLLRELRKGIKVEPRFFTGRRIKGKVEKVWNNQTLKGKRYSVLQIDGEWYSLWNEAYFDRIKTGQTIEFDYRESGKYKNISKIYEPTEAKKYPIRFKNSLR